MSPASDATLAKDVPTDPSCPGCVVWLIHQLQFSISKLDVINPAVHLQAAAACLAIDCAGPVQGGQN